MLFDEIVDERCRKIKVILSSKAEEYATEQDRFHNFEIAARKRGITPERALEGMMLKHDVSVMDLIDWVELAP